MHGNFSYDSRDPVISLLWTLNAKTIVKHLEPVIILNFQIAWVHKQNNSINFISFGLRMQDTSREQESK